MTVKKNGNLLNLTGQPQNSHLQGPVSQRDLSPDLHLNVRLWA